MKPSILVVMLDFLVCSLLLFVIGKGGSETQFATSPAPAVHAEFSAEALQQQQDEWNRTYEHETLVTKLQAETTAKEQLQARLTETTSTLAAREAAVKQLTEEKARVEQAKTQTEQMLAGIETQLTRVVAERERLQKEGEAAKENVAKLQTEQSRLTQQKAELEQHAAKLGQTVASQQATISTLTEEVRAAQTRMESQLTDVAEGQSQLTTTLTKLDEFARTLPGILQKSVVDVRKDQESVQQTAAALAENVKALEAALNSEERTRLMQAVTDVARGQHDIQSQLDTLLKGGATGAVGDSLQNILAGQDALRQQTAKLGEQIESIKARGPGPFKAVKSARLALRVKLATRQPREAFTSSFQATAFAPIINLDGHPVLVVPAATLGFAWGAARNPDNELTDFSFQLTRAGEPPWTAPLDQPACVLRAEAHAVAVELLSAVPGLAALELAGPDAPLQTDQRKLNLFKCTATGLSFEVEASPDLADARYVIVKRALRGVAGWFENPAYRPDTGDYLVTADGKLIGLMINRERCLILTPANLRECAHTVPLSDRAKFLTAIRQTKP